MDIINNLKEVWFRLKPWKKWLLGACAIITLILLILVHYDVIKPESILGGAFVIFVIHLMIRLRIIGKKRIDF
ncbi:MAG: hypothetical protein KAR87_05345 [Candidatus Aenigmarchaeota archaeon]|nr:hypothetical protein [Candidatus Aenigmarchaeota archaeon]